MERITESTQRLGELLERQRKLMPPEVQREWEEREKREAELTVSLLCQADKCRYYVRSEPR